MLLPGAFAGLMIRAPRVGVLGVAEIEPAKANVNSPHNQAVR
jgi:hypothetical protein